jgi:hypothetical protein
MLHELLAKHPLVSTAPAPRSKPKSLNDAGRELGFQVGSECDSDAELESPFGPETSRGLRLLVAV